MSWSLRFALTAVPAVMMAVHAVGIAVATAAENTSVVGMLALTLAVNVLVGADYYYQLQKTEKIRVYK